MLVQKVATFIETNKLISANDHIVVALSGGRDSMCLLDILLKLKEPLKLTLSAIHVNHCTRGRSSDDEQNFVETFLTKIGTKYSVQKLKGFNERSGEDALRKARYDVFEKHLKEFKNAKIATAHHIDDQIETVLMRIFKGSGIRGLRGIAAKRDNFIRPLLCCSREEISKYCLDNKIKYCDDKSNNDISKLRNNIRHNILPNLKTVFGKKYTNDFYKSHTSLNSFYNDFQKVNFDFFAKKINKTDEGINIPILFYKRLSQAQKELFVQYCFFFVYGLNFRLGTYQISQFDNFINSTQVGATFQFAQKACVLKDRSALIFYISDLFIKTIRELSDGENVNFGGFNVGLKKLKKSPAEFISDSNQEMISGDTLNFPLIIRYWKEGDYFYPLGGAGRQKLSDFLINQKVNLRKKERVFVIENNGKIIWLAGFRLDERFKITAKSKSFYKLSVKKLIA